MGARHGLENNKKAPNIKRLQSTPGDTYLVPGDNHNIYVVGTCVGFPPCSSNTTTLDWAHMLTLPSGAILYMSILQCGLRLSQRYNSYVHAETPQQLSLLRGPLVAWNSNTDEVECGTALINILTRNINTNPILKEYSTILETSSGEHLHNPAVSVLPLDVIPTQVQTAQARHPTASQEAMAAANPLCTAIDLDAQQPLHERQQRTAYLAGETMRRGTAQKRPLHAQPDGTTSTPLLTVESALFPVLFPKGRHFFTGEGRLTLSDYLEQRMMALFSPWTLIKEYPLLMYQVSPAINLFMANQIFPHLTVKAIC